MTYRNLAQEPKGMKEIRELANQAFANNDRINTSNFSEREILAWNYDDLTISFGAFEIDLKDDEVKKHNKTAKLYGFNDLILTNNKEVNNG